MSVAVCEVSTKWRHLCADQGTAATGVVEEKRGDERVDEEAP